MNRARRRWALDGRIEAWECIGCGRIEAPQDRIGVWQDRKVELLHATSYDELQRRLDGEQARSSRLLTLVQQPAWSRPRDGAWERSYLALQEQARALEQVREQLREAERPAQPVARLEA